MKGESLKGLNVYKGLIGFRFVNKIKSMDKTNHRNGTHFLERHTRVL